MYLASGNVDMSECYYYNSVMEYTVALMKLLNLLFIYWELKVRDPWYKSTSYIL